jgi:hypothetical protein
MKHFSVVLPSDSSMNYFPTNTVARYKTKLLHPICDEYDYEVALTELIYPMNYNNFITKEPLVIIHTAEDVENRWELSSGYFKNEDVLADYMNKEYQKIYGGELKPFFAYDKLAKQMRFEFTGAPCDRSKTRVPKSAGLNEAFMDRFGLFNQGGSFELGGQRLMYVYCNIVSPYLVGDVQVPLLRVIAPKGERDEMITLAFNKPYYLPVAQRRFDTIEINITDELGEPMPFTGGKSVSILHFRCLNST